MNSLDVDAATGDVIMSARHLDAVFRIRRNPGGFDDGRVLWKLGGNAPTDPATLHFAIDGDPLGGPARQHDARLSPDGFLTDVRQSDQPPRNPVVTRARVRARHDAGTATMVWQFRHPAGSQAACCGSTRDQPDGAVVIGWGGAPPLLTEVGPWGDVTLQVTQVPFGAGYRAIKVRPGAFSRSAASRERREMMPGVPDSLGHAPATSPAPWPRSSPRPRRRLHGGRGRRRGRRRLRVRNIRAARDAG